MTPFAACAAEVRRLVDGVADLDKRCEHLQMPPLAGQEWYEILQRKLAPQLAEEPFLVAAVVGGTNIGKSAIFNHIAGCRASASSPLASGTRHPVCLVPDGFERHHDLSLLFQGFNLLPWSEAEDALQDSDEHRLYWRTAPELPANLLVLDTPDIDSDAPVNWLRADYIRHASDVLIAVLTQQKYNDAAVKVFFRKAAAEDKSIIVVFNQCLLPEDEAFWPLWMETFSRETGIVPDHLYLIPNDRRAATENRLPVYRRAYSPKQGAAAETEASTAPDSTPHRLGRELSELHFSAIKLRTMQGALRQVLSAEQGVPFWLAEVRNRSLAFRDAMSLLTAQQLARIDNWPAAPAGMIVSQVTQWWRDQRRGWTRSVHDTYSLLGNGLLWPVRWVQRQVQGEVPDPAAAYLRQERDVILQALDKLYDELTRLSQLGNDLLRPRLERLLAGATRERLLRDLSEAQAKLDVAAELQGVVATQMELFGRESPQTFELLKKLDSLAAMARPMTSVVLFFAAGPGGHVLTDAAAHGLLGHIVGDIAGGTGAVVVGETAITGAAGGVRYLEVRFRQLQSAFSAKRVAWFAEFLRSRLLGPLQDDLQTAAGIPDSPEFRQVAEAVKALAAQSTIAHRDASLKS